MNIYFWIIKYDHKVNSSDTEKGFTLIELIVVIMILSILMAIALPSMLSQVNKAKQTEGKQTVSTMCRGQQMYFLENGKFTTIIPQLNLDMVTETANYNYSIFQQGFYDVMNLAKAKDQSLKSYVCVIHLQTNIPNQPHNNISTFICEAKLEDGSSINVIDPAQCPQNFVLIKQ